MGILLHRAHRRLDAIASELVASSGLTARQFQVLVGVVFQGPCSQHLIGDKLGIDGATLTGVVNRLEQRGLLKRLQHPTDRRARHLAATSAGQRLVLEEQADFPARADAQLLRQLTEDEREDLRRLLGKIAFHTAD